MDPDERKPLSDEDRATFDRLKSLAERGLAMAMFSKTDLRFH